MKIVDINSKRKKDTKKISNEEFLKKAVTLSEALPFIKEFSGEIFVIKIGGSSMENARVVSNFANDVVLLKKLGINPVIVHGGGPQIGKMLEKLKIQTSFVDGLRVTCKDAVEIVEMVLCGKINKDIVNHINLAGGLAIGLSGKDAKLLEAKRVRKTSKEADSNIEKLVDLGYVGEVTQVNPDIFIALDESEIIPVIAPVGVGEGGETYNINADDAAASIAASLNAAKLIMMTDVDGILDENKKLISRATAEEIAILTKKGVINGGMIPKTTTCLKAVNSGVESAHILNGTIDHILLAEIFTESGSGTMISNL